MPCDHAGEHAPSVPLFPTATHSLLSTFFHRQIVNYTRGQTFIMIIAFISDAMYTSDSKKISSCQK